MLSSHLFRLLSEHSPRGLPTKIMYELLVSHTIRTYPGCHSLPYFSTVALLSDLS